MVSQPHGISKNNWHDCEAWMDYSASRDVLVRSAQLRHRPATASIGIAPIQNKISWPSVS
jgi:hypothetical protein